MLRISIFALLFLSSAAFSESKDTTGFAETLESFRIVLPDFDSVSGDSVKMKLVALDDEGNLMEGLGLKHARFILENPSLLDALIRYEISVVFLGYHKENGEGGDSVPYIHYEGKWQIYFVGRRSAKYLYLFSAVKADD